MRRALILIVALAIFGFALALVLVNLADVAVSYLFGTVTVPLAGALAVVLLAGVVIGALCAVPAVLKARMRVRQVQGRLAEVEAEVRNLRRMPLRDAR